MSLGSVKFYGISLLLALLFLSPCAADLFNVSIPLARLWSIPGTGLDYMSVFFHELGHTAASWLFGYPAIPTFDFEYGGGMTYGLAGRYWALQGLFFFLGGAGLFWLYRHEAFAELRIAGAVFAVYVLLALTPAHTAVPVFMGYGVEIGIAVFCLLRALLGTAAPGAIEKYLNMIFGLYVFGRNMLLLGGLYFSDIAREAYGLQKGGEISGDFQQLAELWDMTIQNVALLAGLYLLAGLAIVFRALRQAELH